MVATIGSGQPGSGNPGFTRALRHELAGEEGRALLSSYGVSSALAAAWLLAVYLAPASAPLRLIPTTLTSPISIVEFSDPAATPTTVAREPGGRGPSGGGRAGGTRSVAAALGSIFGTRPSASTGTLLSGVDLVRAGGGAGSRSGGSGKVGLSTGSGAGDRVGRGDLGGSGSAGALGAVTGGGGPERAGGRVSLPAVVVRQDLRVARSSESLRDFVRARDSQLQSCYEREGLHLDPSLAGSLSLRLTIAGRGAVTDVEVAKRSWSGPAADATERCLRAVIARWVFPPTDEGDTAYPLALSFTAR